MHILELKLKKLNKMNKLNFIIIIMIILYSCTNQDPLNAQTIINLDAQEFKKLLSNQNSILIDVRTEEEIKNGYINNATFINYYDNEFNNKIKLLNKNAKVFIYCRSGGRSYAAAEKLKKIGFSKIYNLEKGIESWEKNNYEITNQIEIKEKSYNKISYNQIKKILKSSRPTLVSFTTKWCVPCKKMNPIIKEIEREGTYVIYIDIDQNKNLQEEFNITGIPTFLIYIDGKEKFRHTGIINKKELQEKLF